MMSDYFKNRNLIFHKNNLSIKASVSFFLIISTIFIQSFLLSPKVANASTLTDSFTGTTIDTSKWTETDAGGLGGTVGNIQQNGTLSLTGNSTWGINKLVTNSIYDRTQGNMTLDVDVTVSNCTSGISPSIGYGDSNVTNGGTQAYTVYYFGGHLFLSRQNASANAENIQASFVCTNNVPFHLQLLVNSTTGASLYVNGSGTPDASVTGGNFNNASFFLQGFAGTSIMDNLSISGANSATVPGAPTSLTASITVSNSVDLSWTAPVNSGGSSITDYIIQYKLSTEPTVWTTFADGTSTSTSATVTGLTNGLSYDFRVSAVNSIGNSSVSNTATSTPGSILIADSFTGTTIDTTKWTETDAGGVGGTVGNIRQNGTLSLTGNLTWGANRLVTNSTYDRTLGNLSEEADITMSSCPTGVVTAIGYGDPGVLTGGGQSYTVYYNSSHLFLSRQNANANAENVQTTFACTDNVPFHVKLVINSSTGASLYINNSGTPAATVTGGTFNNKSFFVQGYAGTGIVDNFAVSISNSLPSSPTGLIPTAGDNQVSLTWTPSVDNGSSITDYIIQYKLSTEPTVWTTFADGTSTSTSATVTGLTNGLSYDFRVSAVNSIGTSSPSSVVNATPFSNTPIAPIASSVSISGLTAVGEQVTGTYTFNDMNGDTEATSTYRWLTSGTSNGTYTAISGATSITYTITSGDLNKYLKFEVTPVSNVSPTTGSPVLSSSSQVSSVSYINQILSTGQSLSVGAIGSPPLSTAQPYSNLMLSGGNGGLGLGTSFIPLVEGSVETMSSSMANTITANNPGYDVAVSLHGVSGYTYSQLKKGTTPYSNGMTQVTNTKNAAIALGRASRVIGVTTIHGETDSFNGVDGSTYEGYLQQWQNDYQTDVQAITGQTGIIPMFTDQMSSYMSTYANMATSPIPIAQLAASEDNVGKIYLVGPKYFLTYSDRHHLTNTSYRWLGEYYGKIIKKVVIDHVAWRPLSPNTISRNANVIYATFHVPAGQLVFDTSLVTQHANYGFEYYDSTSSASITNVQIINSNTVKVTLSTTPTGSNQRLRYAYTGVPGTNTNPQNPNTAAGNLRDTDSYPSAYGNTLYNWGVHFDKTITVDTTAPSSGSITYTSGSVTSSVPLTVNDGTDSGSGIDTSSRIIQRKSATLTNGVCGTYGSFANITPSGVYPNYTDSNISVGNCYQYQYLVSDIANNQAVYTSTNTAKVDPVVSNPVVVSSGGSHGGGLLTLLNQPQQPTVSPFPSQNNPISTLLFTKPLNTVSDIKLLQTVLNYSLNSNLVIDGISGRKTKASIKIFQKNHNLIPDGIVGPKTREVLNSIKILHF